MEFLNRHKDLVSQVTVDCRALFGSSAFLSYQGNHPTSNSPGPHLCFSFSLLSTQPGNKQWTHAFNMETLRRIELQEPDDLVYIINNVRAAAMDQLNEAFPPVEGQDGHGDELRLLIEAEVNEVRRLPSPLIASRSISLSAASYFQAPWASFP